MRDSRVRRLSRLHRLLYQMTGGVVGRRLVDNDMLLLTTTGRRTGKRHTVPLLYLQEGGRYLVVASYGGRPYHPAWYLNLVEDPVVMVRTPTETFTARATTAEFEERLVWWPRVLEAYHGYSTYQSRTQREIPLVFLDPMNPPAIPQDQPG